MKVTAILGGLAVAGLLSATSGVEARTVKPHTVTRAKPATSTPGPTADRASPVIRRHKCVVGCG